MYVCENKTITKTHTHDIFPKIGFWEYKQHSQPKKLRTKIRWKNSPSETRAKTHAQTPIPSKKLLL